MLDHELIDTKARLLSSLLLFTRFFYKERTNRDFIVSKPDGRESHHIIICRELTNLFYLRKKRLYINIHPGSGKSELCRHFVAWALAHYPDCNFLYISFSYERAEENTAIIREIMDLPKYRKLFGVNIHPDFNSKGNFKTTAGGKVIAFGSAGSITGADAGLPGLDRFSGGVIMDDMHKPEEVHSDTIREAVIRNYQETISYRLRGETATMLGIGQRLREDDLFNYLETKETDYWSKIVLPTEDVNKNVLYPEVNTPDKIKLAKLSRYAWAAQHQQNPIPVGGGIFQREDFFLIDNYPTILGTFITADTAETDKTYNDATVFSFWGLHKISIGGVETDVYGLVWLDCRELWLEPKDLETEFLHFYRQCMMFHVKPYCAAIEKKSTGVTLLSALKQVQGIKVVDIERNRSSGSKTTRFLDVQSIVANKRISLLKMAKHTNMCIEHCAKITANDTHARDDIADTLADAVKIALQDEVIPRIANNVYAQQNTAIVKAMADKFHKIQRLRSERQW